MPSPDADSPAGELGFTFDRSGYRVPAILVSPWVAQGSVFNDEYRHTSLIATLRKAWNLGEPLTQRDATARTFDDLFTLDVPRDPDTWATMTAHPVPEWHLDEEALAKGLSGLGKSMGRGIIEHARELGVDLPPQLDDPGAELTPDLIVEVLRDIAWHYFPRLAPADSLRLARAAEAVDRLCYRGQTLSRESRDHAVDVSFASVLAHLELRLDAADHHLHSDDRAKLTGVERRRRVIDAPRRGAFRFMPCSEPANVLIDPGDFVMDDELPEHVSGPVVPGRDYASMLRLRRVPTGTDVRVLGVNDDQSLTDRLARPLIVLSRDVPQQRTARPPAGIEQQRQERRDETVPGHRHEVGSANVREKRRSALLVDSEVRGRVHRREGYPASCVSSYASSPRCLNRRTG